MRSFATSSNTFVIVSAISHPRSINTSDFFLQLNPGLFELLLLSVIVCPQLLVFCFQLFMIPVQLLKILRFLFQLLVDLASGTSLLVLLLLEVFF